MSVQVPKGYKQTEVGVIPEDWLCGFTADVVKSMKAGLSRRLQERDIGIPVLISGNIENDRLSVDNLKYWYLNDPQGAKVENYILKEGDILLCFINSLAQIGKPCIFQDIGRPAIYTTNLFRIIINENATYKFAFYLFSSRHFQEKIQLIAKIAVNQASFTKPDFLKLAIPIPPVNEQHAIAEALSDADALIESLEQLIAKKRQIKQGAMQELMTGQRRLPGFSGEWKNFLWGDLLISCSSGATPFRGNPEYYKGNINWVSSGELNYNVIYETIEHVSTDAINKTNLKIHPPGTFLMAITGLEAAGTRGSCAILGVESATNQSCMAIYPGPNLSPGFLYNYYVFKGDELAFKYCQGTKQQSYTANIVKLLPIFIPPSLEEQKAISSVFEEMDDEIKLLVEKLEKARQIKQAMMQELLTGRIRLI